MKFSIFSLSVCLFYIGHSQSEAETISFINTKLSLCGKQMPIPGDISAPMTFSLETSSRNGEKIFLMVEEVHHQSFDGPFLVHYFNPESIVDISVTKPNDAVISLNITSRDSDIKVTSITGSIEYVKTYELWLKCPESTVLRIEKAFEHLFEMNGAELISDDLFKN